MFKTILTNLLSIHKPRANSDDIMVRVKVSRRLINSLGFIEDGNIINWHVFKLPNRDQSLIIDDIKIEAEII